VQGVVAQVRVLTPLSSQDSVSAGARVHVRQGGSRNPGILVRRAQFSVRQMEGLRLRDDATPDQVSIDSKNQVDR